VLLWSLSTYILCQDCYLASSDYYYRHWQLRSFVSAPKSNLVYYLNGPEIVRLNTAARERETITTLPFSPRCLVAGESYICCGGDQGDFAVVRLGPREGPLGTYATGVEGEPDSRLPLNLDPIRHSPLIDRSEAPGLRRREFLVKNKKVGKEIVNCVTLWFPKPGASDKAYSEPVAVLSNNDHTVSIVSLPEIDVLETLELDDSVNRAVISPDGNILVAIGDDPYMYIYERRVSGPKKARDLAWIQVQKVQLPGQRHGDECEIKGSFATAFSPSNRYVAVGTQYGLISVYETRLLMNLDIDPLVVTFTTSRPEHKEGAVRAMDFSPGPYDLLAWTEHHGKVTVADLRQNFISRQVIVTDPRADGMERVAITECPDDFVIDPRLRQQPDPEGNPSEFLSAEMERMQRRYLSTEAPERYQTRLTPEETAVLEALQVHRRQRDQEAVVRQAQSDAAQHTPLTWTDLADDVRANWRERSGLGLNWREDGSVRRTPTALPSSLRDFVSGRPNDSLRAYIDERNRERQRGSQQPRRRGSVILAAAQSALERDSQEAPRETPQLDAASGRAVSLMGIPRLPAIGSDPPGNPWAEIEALYNIAVDPPVDPAARLRIEIDADNRREYTRRLEQRWRGFEEGRNQLRLGLDNEESGSTLNRRNSPMDTTGCCWSQDGRIL
jgi:hypothetical protein